MSDLQATAGQSGTGPRLWTRGDLDGFFGLFSNSLANTLTAVFLLSVVLALPGDIVWQGIVPGFGVTLAFGNLFLAWQAWKLGKKEGRDSVTALPYGLSVPHYFIVTFAIMMPLIAKTGDARLAWGVAMAWTFIHGIVVAIGAFVGDWLRKVTPRAAMLGTLAGMAVSYIALTPSFRVYDAAWLGLICFGILLFGWLANIKMPLRLPAGLLAIIIGTILGWVTGYMKVDPLIAATQTVGFNVPLIHLDVLMLGFANVGPYVVSAIPLAVYLFMETLMNVESAEVAGDKYSARSICLGAAGGTLVGALFGSVVPTLVYIGHPGWKQAGGRIGYSWATGVAMLLLCTFGMINILLNIIPIVAILPILMYIAMLILSQAFRETPKAHAPAVAIALIPWLADWVKVTIDNTLNAAGTSVATLGADKLAASGVFYDGMAVLGASAILVAMMLAAIVARVIDRNYLHAAVFALLAALMSFFGVIHATGFGIGMATGPAIGYLVIAAGCFLFHVTRGSQPSPSDDAP
ncbi:MAG: xanthine permease [Laribacter sp.]|nr:xanthine permease [Laribacter sp.]MBP9527266.1 xanthine permease [Laribacter sp.]